MSQQPALPEPMSERLARAYREFAAYRNLDPSVEVSDEMEAFLVTLATVDPRTFLERVPGLGSGWQARWVTKGLQMGAIKLHPGGEFLALTERSDELFRQIHWVDRHSSPARVQLRSPREAAELVARAVAERRQQRPVPPLEDF